MWTPISDIDHALLTGYRSELAPLAQAWSALKGLLAGGGGLRDFNARLSREWAIETGLIERVYTLDRGTTVLLIEQGIDAALIPRTSTDLPVQELVQILRDHEEAIEALLDFIGNQRELSLSFIHELHSLLLRHQETTLALDQFGNYARLPLRRGAWKLWPNNPLRADGALHEYCPPEQVQGQMEELLRLHREHAVTGVSPELQAAWLHHRFTQIHPYQDGNGRVARALATLVLLKHGWFPLVVRDADRWPYLSALEQADAGDLAPLTHFFAAIEEYAFRRAASLAPREDGTASVSAAMAEGLEYLRQKQSEQAAALLQPAREAVARLAEQAQAALARVVSELDRDLQSINPGYHSSAGASTEDTRLWYAQPISAVAAEEDYYADLPTLSRWLRWRIQEDKEWLLVVSFHSVGHRFSGVCAASALCFDKYTPQTASGPPLEEQEPQPAELSAPRRVHPELFMFEVEEAPDQLSGRFAAWLDNCLAAAVADWRSHL
jgi:hypothetical protein